MIKLMPGKVKEVFFTVVFLFTLLAPFFLGAWGQREVKMQVMGPDCGHEVVYRRASGGGETSETYAVHAERADGSDEPVFHSISVYDDRVRCITMRQADLTPVSMVEKWNTGERLIQRTYGEGKVHVLRRAVSYPIDEVIEVPPDTHDPESFAFLLKGYPFEEQDAISPINVLVAEPNPFFKPRPFSVHIVPLGEERVTVPSGTFDCYLLEMTLTGILGYIVPDNRFWLLKDYPHLIVKVEGAGELIELVEGPFKCDGKERCAVGAEACVIP